MWLSFVLFVAVASGDWVSFDIDALDAKLLNNPDVVPQYFKTQQDHFDPLNSNTWNQGYYVNDTFWKNGTSAPVFLCVGGEGPPIDASVVSNSVHCNIAVEWLEETGAILFALEHRYYGCHLKESCPVNLSDTNALRYLSSSQALEDTALFHLHATEKYNLQPDNLWIVWGGSYPGMIAAWSRISFPHLFHVAVASSAPVLAQLDMRGYYEVVGNAYATTSVGGSPQCKTIIARGHEIIGGMLGSCRTRSQLENQFELGSKYLEHHDNQVSFCGLGVADFPAQGNDPSCESPVCSIGKICEFLLEKNATVGELEALAQLRKLQKLDSKKLSESRDYWEWQVCTEFGFLQTCAVNSGCIFTQGLVTLETAYHQACDQFNMNDIPKLNSTIAKMNNRHGGNVNDVERILWVNGNVDPWIALSVQHLSKRQQAGNQKVLIVEGASHHAWTHPSSQTDQNTVIQARKLIKETVLEWLSL